MSLWLPMAAADLGKAFQAHIRRSGNSFGGVWFVVILLAVIAFFVVLAYWDRIKRWFVDSVPDEQILFNDLCELHRLADSERALLTKAADDALLPQPAHIFVDRSVLAAYTDKHGVNAGPCAALSRKLFGERRAERREE